MRTLPVLDLIFKKCACTGPGVHFYLDLVSHFKCQASHFIHLNANSNEAFHVIPTAMAPNIIFLVNIYVLIFFHRQKMSILKGKILHYLLLRIKKPFTSGFLSWAFVNPKFSVKRKLSTKKLKWGLSTGKMVRQMCKIRSISNSFLF